MHNSFIYLKLSINFTSNCRRRFLFFNLQCSSLIFSWIFTLKLLANNMNVVRSKFFALMAIFICLFPPRSSHFQFSILLVFSGSLFLLFYLFLVLLSISFISFCMMEFFLPRTFMFYCYFSFLPPPSCCFLTLIRFFIHLL